MNPDPVIWDCQGFECLWQSFVLTWMLGFRNEFKLSHRNQVNAHSNMKLVTSMINFEFQPCGIFESLSYHENMNPLILPSLQLLSG